MKHIAATLLALSLAGCHHTSPQPQPHDHRAANTPLSVSIGMKTIQGTTFYLERIGLPAHTKIDVTVYGKDDEILAQHRKPAPNGPPYSFKTMVPDAAYDLPLQLEIRLLVDTQTVFKSDRVPFNKAEPLNIRLISTR